jgi:hypothetical protein
MANDTIQLLIANTSDSNIHSVANSLMKYSVELVSKNMMDHIRHLSHDLKWFSDQYEKNEKENLDKNRNGNGAENEKKNETANEMVSTLPYPFRSNPGWGSFQLDLQFKLI